jgi:hypothetical protein
VCHCIRPRKQHASPPDLHARRIRRAHMESNPCAGRCGVFTGIHRSALRVQTVTNPISSTSCGPMSCASSMSPRICVISHCTASPSKYCAHPQQKWIQSGWGAQFLCVCAELITWCARRRGRTRSANTMQNLPRIRWSWLYLARRRRLPVGR